MTASRRDFLKSAGLLSVGGMIDPQRMAIHLAEANALRPRRGSGPRVTARGTVFLDRNGSGRREPGDPGVPGVRVSDGLAFATTDAEGRWELEVDADEADIFVCKPRGYRIGVDRLNRPRFYYIHRRGGTPDDGWRHEAIEPTGDLPASIDFPLREQPEPDRFQVALLADPQPYLMEEVDWYARETLTELMKLDLAFGIVLGDLVGDNLDLFEPVAEVQSLMGFPWYTVPGNHDLNYRSPTNRHAADSFRDAWGPTDYAFQHGPVHFVMLNNVWWNGFGGIGDSGHPGGSYRGHFSDEQIEFVRGYVTEVPEHERIVVCAHIPLVNRGWPLEGGDDSSVEAAMKEYTRWEGTHTTPQFPKLLEALSGHRHSTSFTGHFHFNQNMLVGEELDFRPPGGEKHLHFNVGAPSGSWYAGPLNEQGIPINMQRDGTPNGYAVVTFDGADMSIRYKGAGEPEDYQMLIHAPEVVVLGDLDTAEVQANVFAGSSASTTRMRVRGHGGWTKMQQQERDDPAYLALRARTIAEARVGAHARGMAEAGDEPHRELWDVVQSAEHAFYRRHQMPDAMPTDHHWVATLPRDLREGVYMIEVETTDMFGQTFRDFRPLRVVGSMDEIAELDRYNTREPFRG